MRGNANLGSEAPLLLSTSLLGVISSSTIAQTSAPPLGLCAVSAYRVVNAERRYQFAIN